ncbi:MAG: hypothetical protein F6K44_33010 [Moorea sp. SIO3E2]|nr:hypothetical protein [Moorena sp. SIO3E2]
MDGISRDVQSSSNTGTCTADRYQCAIASAKCLGIQVKGTRFACLGCLRCDRTSWPIWVNPVSSNSR